MGRFQAERTSSTKAERGGQSVVYFGNREKDRTEQSEAREAGSEAGPADGPDRVDLHGPGARSVLF